MSIVRTKRQASDLQQCSTSPCVICHSRARIYCEAIIQRWGPSQDGKTVRYDNDRYATAKPMFHPVCRAHADLSGLRLVFIGNYGQFNLVRITKSGREVLQ